MIQSEFQPMSLKLRFYARNGVTLITMIFGWQVFLLYKTQIMVKIVFHTNHKKVLFTNSYKGYHESFVPK